MSLLKPRDRDYKTRATALAVCWFLTMPSIFAFATLYVVMQSTEHRWVWHTSSAGGAALAGWIGVHLYYKYVEWGEIDKLKHILEDAQEKYRQHYEEAWSRLDDLRDDPLVKPTVWYDEAAHLLDILARESRRVQQLNRLYKESKERGRLIPYV